MRTLERVVTKSAIDSDTDQVRWQIGDKQQLGFGYLVKQTGRIGLIRCPACLMENYGPNVVTGICYACEFDANRE